MKKPKVIELNWRSSFGSEVKFDLDVHANRKYEGLGAYVTPLLASVGLEVYAS